MEQRQRRNEPRERGGNDGGAFGEPGDGLNEMRAEADRVVSAADAAIRRTLSGDSLKFGDSVKQRGGE